MRRAAKTIATAMLVLAAAIPAGAGNQVLGLNEDVAPKTVGWTTHFDKQEFCMDRCLIPPKKLAGSGLLQAR